MQIEAYQQTKPPLPRRPVVVTAVLMLGVGCLAVQMSYSRRADPLGSAVRLPELDCSIRVPRGFVRASIVVTPAWRIQPFEGVSLDWGHADLAVWYTPSDDLPGAAEMAHAIFEHMAPGTGLSGQKRTLIVDETAVLGTEPAYEIQDPLAGLVVRVRKLNAGGYLGVSATADRSIQQWYRSFDATCRSVQVQL